jgi:hypothetical protein
MLTTTLKPKTCAHCGTGFMPFRPMAQVCSPICARRKVEADKKAEKASDKARSDKLKTIADLIEEAQEAFNAFIRARDHGKPCICCGKPMERDAWGNPKVNAGHWRSRGAAGHLRFDEANVHAQRTSCNRPGGARPGPFREGMIARVGLAEVERMEADNSIEKWDRDVLRQIKTIYRAKARQLKKEAQ